MGKLYLLLPLLLLATTTFGQIEEILGTQSPQFGNLGSRFDDIHMLTDSVGFATTSEGLILYTTDRFAHYIIAYSTFASSGTDYGRSITFLNDDIGMMGTLNGRLYITTNAGLNWSQIANLLFANDTVPAPYAKGICGLATAGNTVYACGAYFGSPYVARFVHPDSAWVFYDMRQYASGLVDMHWTSADTGFVTGLAADTSEGGIILRTVDGGINWQTVHTTNTPLDIIWKLYPLNDRIIYAAVEEYSPNPSRILKSTDGGLNWQTIVVDTMSSRIQGVGFVNERVGYAGGHFIGYYATTDSGKTWSYIADSVRDLNRFIQTPGGGHLVSGAGIFTFRDSSLTGINNTTKLYNEENILKVVPNPVNGQYTLQIDLPQSTDGNIMVYDISGKVYEKVPQQPWSAGKHRLNFDATNYPAGVLYIAFVTHYGNWFATLVK